MTISDRMWVLASTVVGVFTVRLPLLFAVTPLVSAAVLISDGQWPISLLMFPVSGIWFLMWWGVGVPSRWAQARQAGAVEELLRLFDSVGPGSRTVYICSDTDYAWTLHGARYPFRGVLTRSEMSDMVRAGLMGKAGRNEVCGGTKTNLLVNYWYPVVQRRVVGFTIGGVPARLPAEPEKKVSLAGRIVTAVRLERYARRAQFADVQEIRDAMEYIRRADTVMPGKD